MLHRHRLKLTDGESYPTMLEKVRFAAVGVTEHAACHILCSHIEQDRTLRR